MSVEKKRFLHQFRSRTSCANFNHSFVVGCVQELGVCEHDSVLPREGAQPR